jgi:hypothetical protein
MFYAKAYFYGPLYRSYKVGSSQLVLLLSKYYQSSSDGPFSASSEVAFKEISTNSGLGAGDCFLSYRWVIPVKDISEEDLRYDKEKHREMILMQRSQSWDVLVF